MNSSAHAQILKVNILCVTHIFVKILFIPLPYINFYNVFQMFDFLGFGAEKVLIVKNEHKVHIFVYKIVSLRPRSVVDFQSVDTFVFAFGTLTSKAIPVCGVKL